MNGFFYSAEKKKKRSSSTKSKTTKKQSVSKIFDCSTCGQDNHCNTKFDFYHGEGKKKILILLEYPSERDDKKGEIFSGSKRDILEEVFGSCGIDIDKDCWTAFGVKCHGSSLPTVKEINSCFSKTKKILEELKPEKVIVLGSIALKNLYVDSGFKVDKYEGWVGKAVPDQDLGFWVCCTHPLYLVFDSESPHNHIYRKQFKQHIRKFLKRVRRFPVYDYKEKIKVFESEQDEIHLVEDFLNRVQAGDTIAIDLETTGLKPHAPGHEIICLSIAHKGKAICFPIWDDELLLSVLRNILENPDIKKIAHNLQFEDTWLDVILGIKVQGWHWDTEIATHVQDNRSVPKNLKFLTAIRYGIKNYEKDIEKFLKTKKDDSANAFNKIKEAPLKELMEYCAFDSLFSLWIYKDQQNEFSEREFIAMDFFLNGNMELSQISKKGIFTDQRHFRIQEKTLQKKLDSLYNDIMTSKEVKKWPESTFNFNSSVQLKKLLFGILKYKSVKETAKGSASVDQEALEAFNTDFTNKILEYRKYFKLKNTYLSGFIKESVDNVIRPFFHLQRVVTYRSSSSDPNFQNIPVRDEEAQKIIRKGLIPRPGSLFFEIDYKAIEVAVSACYHKDPAMIKYIKDPSTDMHRDTAEWIFQIDVDKKTDLGKKMRYLAKNGFVFPQFYGDYFVHCAKNIWDGSSEEMKEVLSSNGMGSYRKFENHLKNVEYDFWHKKFPVYSEWKEKTWADYLQYGFIDSLTDFRYSGFMRKNEVLNRGIQGSAFHCLVWSLHHINKYLRENPQYLSYVIGQIHDAIIMDLKIDEKQELFPVIQKIMTEDIRKAWDWIIVPLSVEAEASEKNWAEKAELIL